MMIKYNNLSEAIDFYKYNEANRRFYRFTSALAPGTIINESQSEIIDIIDPTIIIGRKEWLTNRVKVGGLAELLFSKYAEREGWKYEQTSCKDDSKGYDFKVYESAEPTYYEIKMLNKDNRFFITPKELLICSEKMESYKLFLVRKKANLYTGYVLENPYSFFQLDELKKKNLLLEGKGFTIYASTVEIVITNDILKGLKSVPYNVQQSFKVKYKSSNMVPYYGARHDV